MPKIEVVREGKLNSPRIVVNGDLVFIDNCPYIVSMGETPRTLLLTSLDSGILWSEDSFSESLTEYDLEAYINDGFNDDEKAKVELIKSDQYKITINIK